MSNIFGVNVSKCTGEGDGNSLLEIIVDSETSPSGEGVAARSFLLCLLAGVMLTKNDVEVGPRSGSKFSFLTRPGGAVAPGV